MQQSTECAPRRQFERRPAKAYAFVHCRRQFQRAKVRCTLHRRNQLDPSLRRLMHRTQVRDKTRPVAAAAQA
jgi:hypothetical protein